MVAVTTLRGVGPKLAERLQKLNIHQVSDLLFHLPLRYQDRTTLTPIGALCIGEEQLTEGVITGSGIRFGRRRSLLCTIEDGTDTLTIRLFHFNKGQQAALRNGATLRCFGEVRTGQSTLEMVHPEYQLINPVTPPPLEQALTPIYPATEGIRQKTLHTLTTQALQQSLDQAAELLPESVQQEYPTLQQALQQLHRPDGSSSSRQLQHCRERIALEELLAHHLSMQNLRQQQRKQDAPILNPDQQWREQFLQQLPFSLTRAQQRVVREIEADLQQPWPMQRLLQGDVGSGKTLVALCAALQASAAGYQSALMAPTELLASQHQQNLSRLLAPQGIDVGLLSGSMSRSDHRETTTQLANGTLSIVIGTHALFQQGVEFHNLALVIIDEQHRFGVDQRHALQQKGADNTTPHQLIMTATPIPRTLAMTFYADLDSSVIDELPPGRTPIKTVTIPESRRNEIIARVHSNCLEGKQVYWVCPLIEESEVLECQAATDHATALREQLPDLEIGLVHGRLPSAEKEQEMARFHRGESQILVATTVIEVGVDVPNASLMIIENAERLGLAQLHQLRGRVGRGSEASSCVLLYKSPLSQVAKERLQTIRDSSDGFEIARKDLEMRGPGELLGRRQTGLPQLRIADLSRDQQLIPRVEQIAIHLAEEQTITTQLIDRWIPQGRRYQSIG